MTLLRIYCGRGFDSRHLHHHIMFNWLKKITKKQPVVINIAPETQDEIEECLWEIKDQYDLPTEEIDLVVNLKRQNIDYMHKHIKKRRKDV
jgi:hypothetical protein